MVCISLNKIFPFSSNLRFYLDAILSYAKWANRILKQKIYDVVKYVRRKGSFIAKVLALPKSRR